MKKLNLIGMKFGILTVVDEYERTTEKRPLWVCECECGGETKATSNSLRSGNTKSCGCKKRTANLKHGFCNTRIYKIWQNMKSRCYNKNTINYKYYGGKGIMVCSEWYDSFLLFKEWAEDNGYEDSLTIDRKNNTKHYEPDNCRWATMKEQSNNRDNSFLSIYKRPSKVTAKERDMIFKLRKKGLLQKEIAKEMGLKRATVSHILNKRIKNFS